MEEKKSIKISLKTYLISMFVMLLIIGVLLGYILQTGEKINKEITGKNDNKIVDESFIVEEKFTDDEVKKVLENYLNVFHGYGSPEELLNSLDLMSYEEAQNYKVDDENFKTTDILYLEFEKNIKQYTSLENFKSLNENGKFTNSHFKNVDGYVAYFDGGWSGTEYVVKDVTIKGNYSDTRYIAKYCTTVGEVTSEEITLEFDIENDNGNCIISNCYFE